MSKSARSGWCSLIIASASSPRAASPTTKYPSPSKISFRSNRMIDSSSAITTRLSIVILRCPFTQELITRREELSHFARSTHHLGVCHHDVTGEFIVFLRLQGRLGYQCANPRVVQGVVPHFDLFFQYRKAFSGLRQLALHVHQTAFHETRSHVFQSTTRFLALPLAVERVRASRSMVRHQSRSRPHRPQRSRSH